MQAYIVLGMSALRSLPDATMGERDVDIRQRNETVGAA